MADSVKREILLKVNRYKRSNNLMLALDLCNNPIYNNDVSIQHQKMELLCMDKRYKEAIVIGERREFASDISIQLKLVEAYMGIKDYDKAKSICQRPEFVDHPGFIQKSERIRKDLLRTKGTSVKVASNNFQDYIPEVKRLIKESNNAKNPQKKRQLLRKAQGYCTNDAFKNDVDASLYHVKILMMLNEYEQAWQIINDERYQDNRELFIQKVSMLINIGKYDEALALIDNSQFKNDPEVINIKQSILVKKDKGKKIDDTPVQKTSSNEKGHSIADILKFIEKRKLPLESIKSAGASEILKDILIVAYYEVNECPIAFINEYLKEMGVRYDNKADCLDIIEQLERHFNKNIVSYDHALYERLLIISQNIHLTTSRK